MSSGSAVKLIDLFERATSEELKEPDYGLNLEIADRMNQRRRYCVEGIEYFKQLLKSTDFHTVKLTLALLDTCVKNCNAHFHRYVSSRDLVPSLLALLKRRRKKLTIFDKMIGLYKESSWRELEDRVLALIQLWADTFMMQEDKFPAFMKAYRELRKEGHQFPARDPNERFMIKFEGEASPAFELAELEQQMKGIIPGSTGVAAKTSAQTRNRISAPRFREECKEPEDEPKLTDEDVYNLKENLPLIEEALLRAKNIKELQEPSVREVIRKCRRAQKKLIVVVAFKAANNMGEKDTEDLLSILDYVNEKMESFKKAVQIIRKNGSEAEVKSVLEVKEPEKQNQEPLNLLDMGDEFLNVPEKSILDGLDRFIYGADKDKTKTKNLEEKKEEKPMKRLAPPPDLMFEEFKEEDAKIEEREAREDKQDNDPFDLASIIFSGDTEKEITQTPQGVPQGYPQAVPQGYPQGMQQGYPQGIQQGIPQGYPQGMPQGYPQGMQQGMPQGIPQGYPQGMQQGYPQGLPQGYPQGMQQGYPQGLPQGYMPTAGHQAGFPSGQMYGYNMQGYPGNFPGQMYPGHQSYPQQFVAPQPAPVQPQDSTKKTEHLFADLGL